jgi:hypothetical protein
VAPIGIISVSLAAACSKPTGTIAGHLYQVGGPVPGAATPVPGTVYVSGDGSVSVGPDGRFSIAVPAGTYTLAGSSPLIEDNAPGCGSRTAVTVVVGVVAKMDVICDIA